MERLTQFAALAIFSLTGFHALADETIENIGDEVDKRINVQQEQNHLTTRLGNQTVEVYRRADRLRMMKIDPDDAPAYYLKDRNDGRLDDSHDSMEEDVNLRKWRLGQW